MSTTINQPEDSSPRAVRPTQKLWAYRQSFMAAARNAEKLENEMSEALGDGGGQCPGFTAAELEPVGFMLLRMAEGDLHDLIEQAGYTLEAVQKALELRGMPVAKPSA